MTKLFTKFALSLALLAGGSTSFAGVSDVEYRLVYNTTTCMYDVMMNVISGSTASGDEQQAYTAQVSIVLPATAWLDSVLYVSNEPRTGTLSGGVATRGTTPSGWTFTNSTPFLDVNIGSAPVRVYSFTVNPSSAFYPELSATPTGLQVSQVRLFSVKVNGDKACGGGVRLWKNNRTQGIATLIGADPISSVLGFGGKNHNNGITFSFNGSPTTAAGTTQSYKQNNNTITPPKPTITASRAIAGNTIQLRSTVNATGCAPIDNDSYLWTGPNGFSSDLPNAEVTPVVPESFGTYSLAVSDTMGCRTSLALTAIALPVSLAAFNGSPAGCAAALNWQTAAELSFDRFEIQYSNDGQSYRTVGEVASKKAQRGSTYTYSYTQPAGKGLYRLKMIDLGGSSTFSGTVSVQTSCGVTAGEISIAPNPTSGNVSIRGIAAGAGIRVMDMLGKIVANDVSTGTAITINLGSYANGVYNVLVAQNGGWEKVGQIVKN